MLLPLGDLLSLVSESNFSAAGCQLGDPTAGLRQRSATCCCSSSLKWPIWLAGWIEVVEKLSPLPSSSSSSQFSPHPSGRPISLADPTRSTSATCFQQRLALRSNLMSSNRLIIIMRKLSVDLLGPLPPASGGIWPNGFEPALAGAPAGCQVGGSPLPPPPRRAS